MITQEFLKEYTDDILYCVIVKSSCEKTKISKYFLCIDIT